MHAYESHLNKLFLTHNISSNTGVLNTLLDEAQEQVGVVGACLPSLLPFCLYVWGSVCVLLGGRGPVVDCNYTTFDWVHARTY